MSRRLWVSAAIALPAVALAAIACGFAAIWTGSERLANSAFMSFMILLPGGFGFAMWTVEAQPRRLPSRNVRKALRAERDRIALDAEIKRMEREAGIR